MKDVDEITKEELEAAAELLRVKEKEEKKAEIERRKLIQATKPKQKGIITGDVATESTEQEVVPQDTRIAQEKVGIISEGKMFKTVVITEAHKDKGKGVMVEEVKEKKKRKMDDSEDAKLAFQLAGEGQEVIDLKNVSKRTDGD